MLIKKLVLSLSLVMFSMSALAEFTDGLSVGTRYEYNMDNHDNSKMRIFAKKKFLENHSLKFAWTRKTGETINFFNNSLSDDKGSAYIEYEYKFD
tara:strand:+ start:514 stop:798 length:285 start_codon:yes stop_codon:yes gene_type:complete